MTSVSKSSPPTAGPTVGEASKVDLRSQYQSEIRRLEERVSAAQTAISQCKNRIAELQSKLQQLPEPSKI